MIDIAFEKPFISKWIFDIEILFRLKDHNIIEAPVTEWKDVMGSKMIISKEIFRILRDIFKIHKEYKIKENKV